MVERRQTPEQKPPKWWHDALRKNLPGNQVSPERFESFPYPLEGKYLFTIISQTAADTAGHPEGIFVDTSIPTEMANNLEIMMPAITKPITEILIKEGKGHEKIIDHPNPQFAELGLKLNIGNSFIVGVHASNGFIVLSMELPTPEEAQKYENRDGLTRLKEDIVSQYFNLDLLERAKLVSDSEMALPLKKEILKREFTFMGKIIDDSIKSGLFTRKRLDDMQYERLTQHQYEALLSEILNFQTPEQKALIEDRLRNMDNATLAGFFLYYKKYWQEKLGPIS